MPTDPFRHLLDPNMAIAGCREMIDLACPLIREVVNHATMAHQRCHVEMSAHSRVDEDIPPLVLYRNVIEFSDAIEVLLANACVPSTIPLLRSSFEASLSLEYILAGDYSQRSLSWLCEHIHSRLRFYELFDSTCTRGQEFATAWSRERMGSLPPQPEIANAISNLRSWLDRPHLVAANQEYERQQRPKWYASFGGPNTFRDLAIALGHQTEYDFLYRFWSSVTHTTNMSEYVSAMSNGSLGFISIRHPTSFRNVALLTLTLLLRSTTNMLRHYRSESIAAWYVREVRAGIDRLSNIQITINTQEHY